MMEPTYGKILKILFWILIFAAAMFGFMLYTALAADLFASAPAQDWLDLPDEIKPKFVQKLAEIYLKQNPQCDGVKIDAVVKDDVVLFFTECLKRPQKGMGI